MELAPAESRKIFFVSPEVASYFVGEFYSLPDRLVVI